MKKFQLSTDGDGNCSWTRNGYIFGMTKGKLDPTAHSDKFPQLTIKFLELIIDLGLVLEFVND